MAEIDTLFKMLVQKGGSDLHMTAGRPVLIRRDGDMQSLAADLPPAEHDEVKRMLYEIMPARNIEEFEQTGDTDLGYEVPGLTRLRINVLRDRFGMGCVCRVIPTDIVTAEQLELPRGVTDLCYLSKGLVVVTGPTGSGKSTTLAAMVDLINRKRTEHIITIEDPIEFVHEDIKCRVTQREVHNHTQSFARALRAALRQDPDIVLVGEMRDLETIETAIETAETGHLVFGTLHTTTAASTVDRIIDSFPADRQNQIRAMLANSLKAAISQTLCKKKDGGRIAALEILIVNRGVSALIRDGKVHQITSLMQTGGAQGMVLLNDTLIDYVRNDIVTPQQAYLKAVDKEDLLSKFKSAGIPADTLHD